MTTFSKKAFKGLPMGIKIRKPRHYYKDLCSVYGEDSNVDINVEKYAGVPVVQGIGEGFVNFKEDTLWDRTVSPAISRVLAPAPYEYLTKKTGVNYKANGSVTVSNNVVSGFASSSYLEIPVINLNNANTWETKFKFTTGSAVTEHYCLFQSCIGTGTNDRYGMLQIIEQGKMMFQISFDGSSWVECAGFDVDVNTTYYMKAFFDGEKYVLEYSLNDVDYTKAGEYVTTDKISYDLNKSIIGNYYAVNSWFNYWQGSIDLNESYIKVNGVDVWGKNGLLVAKGLGCMYGDEEAEAGSTYNIFSSVNDITLKSDDTDIEGYTWAGTFRTNNIPEIHQLQYTEVGQLTYDLDYNASEFNIGKVIYTPVLDLNTSNETICYVFKVKPGKVESTWRILMGNKDSVNNLLGVGDGKWFLWNISTPAEGGTYEFGSTYWVSVMVYPDQTIVYYMKDDGTFKDISELPLPAIRGVTQPYWSTGPIMNASLFVNTAVWIGSGSDTSSQYWTGSVNLKNTIIYKNYNNTTATAEVIWKPFKTIPAKRNLDWS